MTPRPLALVTGASSGIGRELAALAVAEGHDLVAVARRQDRLEALASELGEDRVSVVVADLANPGAPRQVVDALDGRRVDLLVNNAGFGTTGAFVDLDLERELSMVQVNVVALMGLTGLLLPPMVEQGAGRILNIASTAAFQAGPYMATYFATKAFVLSWSEALDQELQGTGVSVTCHCPGATLSEFGAVAGNERNKLFTRQTPASSASVAAHAWAATQAGRRLAIPGLANALGAFGTRLLPRRWTTALAASLNQE